MHDPQLKPSSSSSRSLPPLGPATLDRGRPKTRATDPESHARAHNKNATSVSLPPIRPGARGSRDEEHALPGISAILEADTGKPFNSPAPHHPSESSKRGHFKSLTQDQKSVRRAGPAYQANPTVTPHKRSQDSISTLGADGSRPSSPDASSTLSSSFASIRTTTSLSSILEDRSACGSPPPILPSFSHLDNAHGAIPPMHVSPRSSVFELSDLRTHLPIDESTVRAKPTPANRATIGSLAATPLRLSSSDVERFNFKPDVTGSKGHHKKAPSESKLSTNKKSLFVDVQQPVTKKPAPSSSKHDNGHSHKHDQPATGGGSPVLSPIKVEFEAKAGKHVASAFDAKSSHIVDDRPHDLRINTSEPDQDDTMSCTPTQTISHSSQLPTREHSPARTIELAPKSPPRTPIMRHRSPVVKQSPITSSSASSHSDSDPLSPPDSDNEDTKSLVKDSAPGGDERQSAGARYAERSGRNHGVIDPSSVKTRGREHSFPWGAPPPYAPSWGFTDMGMDINWDVDPGAIGMGVEMGIGTGTGMEHIPVVQPPSTCTTAAAFNGLEQQSYHQTGITSRPTHQHGWANLARTQVPRRRPTNQLQQQLNQQILQKEQELQTLKIAAQQLDNFPLGSGVDPNPVQQDFSRMTGSLYPITQNDSFVTQSSTALDLLGTLPPASEPVPVYSKNSLSLPFDVHEFVPPTQSYSILDDPLLFPLTNEPRRSPEQLQSLQSHDTMLMMPSHRPAFTTPPAETSTKNDTSTSTSPGSGSGAGAHKCEVCGKKFRRPSGLKDHMNIHSGDKPYCCPLDTCRKGFATRSNMIRHHNKTHPSRPKIGGVADIGPEIDEVDHGDHESSPAASAGSGSGGASNQNRFRVVPTMDGGVGPTRGMKDRRAIRQGHPMARVA